MMIYTALLLLLLTAANCLENNQTSNLPLSPLLTIDSPMPLFVNRSKLPSDEGKLATKTVITVPATVTYHSDGYPLGPICTEAMRFALDRLRKQPNWLPNYEIEFEVIDDQCTDGDAIRELMDRFETNEKANNRFPIALLTDCALDLSQLVTASIIKQYNFVGFTVAVNSFKLFSDRPKFGNYYGFGIERPDAYFVALINFLEAFGWKKIAIISEMDPFCDSTDRYLVRLLDEANISLLYMGKVAFQSKDETEMSSNYEIIKSRDARLIMSNAVSSVNIACWLHRYGMYGPNYVVFILDWNYFDENAQIPDYLPWCTRNMLLDVLASVIVFADSTRSNVMGPNTVDSLGLREDELNDGLKSQIAGADLYIPYWAPYFYDRALYTGLLINATEAILNSRNETISDWLTNTAKFQQNGSSIVRVLKEAIHQLKVTGIKGEYQFDENGTTTGFVPIAFNQIILTNDSKASQRIPLGYYKGNEHRMMFSNSVKWRTFDGLPPLDSVVIVNVKRPVLPHEAAEYVFETIAAILIAISFVFALVWLCYPPVRKRVSDCCLPILLGNVMAMLHIFISPNIEKLGNSACSAIVILVFIGYSLINAAVAEKLRRACWYLPTAEQQRGYHPAFTNRTAKLLNDIQGWVVSKHLLYSFVWPVMQFVLIMAALSCTTPPVLQAQVMNLTLEFSLKNPNIAYRPFRYQCDASMPAFEENLAVPILLSFICIFEIYQLIRVAFFGYLLQSNRKRFTISSNLKRTATFIYCEILVIIGAFFIGTLGIGSMQYLLVVTSCVAVVLVILNLALVVFPQLANGDIASNDSKIILRVQPSLARTAGRTPPIVRSRTVLADQQM